MIQTIGLSKIYKRGAEEVHALKEVSITIKEGEFVSIVGPSGSGKTTLLHMLGCMDSPTSGTLIVNGNNVSNYSEAQMTRLRRELFGFVFQQFYLIPSLTVYKNILLPLLFSGRSEERGYISHLIELVGLRGKESHLPHQLSGGEMQRVAVARALINRPVCILADEPTGNLDSLNSDRVFEVFKRLNKDGHTIIMVTHNNELAAKTDRRITLKDGSVVPF